MASDKQTGVEPAAAEEAAEPTGISAGFGAIRTGVFSYLGTLGELYIFSVRTMRILVVSIFKRTFPWPEFVEQAWFIASVCILPTILIAIPFGLIIALEVGSIAHQIGATSYIGAVDAIGTLREAAPIVTALLVAGSGGSAICSDIGSRTIKEEVSALEVMGLDPIERWIGPRVLAALVVAVLLNGIVAFVGIASGYLFDVLTLHGTPGAFLGSFSAFARIDDIVVSSIKAGVFGTIAALIASYKGLGVKRGAAGVGMAVTESVVLTGIVLFAANLLLTQAYYSISPPRIS